MTGSGYSRWGGGTEGDNIWNYGIWNYGVEWSPLPSTTYMIGQLQPHNKTNPRDGRAGKGGREGFEFPCTSSSTPSKSKYFLLFHGIKIAWKGEELPTAMLTSQFLMASSSRIQ